MALSAVAVMMFAMDTGASSASQSASSGVTVLTFPSTPAHHREVMQATLISHNFVGSQISAYTYF